MNNTVLIIEDDILNMKLVNDLLRWRGYQTVQSTTGDDVAELVATCNPDLILMDCQLPVRSGPQIFRSLQAGPAKTQIPVVILTAFADGNTRDLCREHDCAAYLQKPFTIPEFFQTVGKYLPGNAMAAA
ncbi:MAG: response regulator [Rhodospirillales bacterium]|nr:response regulator [Rhodospirillales bacterium]